MPIPEDPDQRWEELRQHFFEELREPTAYHESGHFVLSIFTGDVSLDPREEEKIDLVPQRDRGDWAFTRLRQRAFLDNRREALGRAVHLCGGHAAQCRFDPSHEDGLEILIDEQLTGAERGDFSTAAEVLSGFFESDGIGIVVQETFQHARRLVRDSAVWGAVEHVATGLLDLPPEETVIRGEELSSLKLDVLDRLSPARERLDPTP